MKKISAILLYTVCVSAAIGLSLYGMLEYVPAGSTGVVSWVDEHKPTKDTLSFSFGREDREMREHYFDVSVVYDVAAAKEYTNCVGCPDVSNIKTDIKLTVIQEVYYLELGRQPFHYAEGDTLYDLSVIARRIDFLNYPQVDKIILKHRAIRPDTSKTQVYVIGNGMQLNIK